MKFAHELCWQTTKQCQSHKIVLVSLQAMFNMSSSFLDDTLQSAAPLIDGTINEVLGQFAPLCDIIIAFYYKKLLKSIKRHSYDTKPCMTQ